jgi:hypothetical protein
LADAGCAAAGFPELLRVGSPIQVNDSLLVSSKQVLNLLSGLPAKEPSMLPSPEVVKIADQAFEALFRAQLAQISGATEERTRKALNIDELELAKWSAKLWDSTFSEERDRRAGAGANPQKRGQVTRQMRAELEAAIRAAEHGDNK